MCVLNSRARLSSRAAGDGWCTQCGRAKPVVQRGDGSTATVTVQGDGSATSNTVVIMQGGRRSGHRCACRRTESTPQLGGVAGAVGGQAGTSGRCPGRRGGRSADRISAAARPGASRWHHADNRSGADVRCWASAPGERSCASIPRITAKRGSPPIRTDAEFLDRRPAPVNIRIAQRLCSSDTSRRGRTRNRSPSRSRTSQTPIASISRCRPAVSLPDAFSTSSGEPVSDVLVNAQRQQFINGVRRPMSTRRAVQFERHRRVSHLRACTWRVLRVSEPSRDDINPIEVSTDRSGYAPTYYPSTTDVAAAQRVTVRAGDTVSNIVVTLSPTRMARVSGLVLDAQGQPVKNGAVMAMSASAGVMGGRSHPAAIRPDGTFVINGLAPGSTCAASRMASASAPGTPADGRGVSVRQRHRPIQHRAATSGAAGPAWAAHRRCVDVGAGEARHHTVHGRAPSACR